MGDLAQRGETRTKDIQKAARELAERSARNQRELARLIQKEIKRQVESLGLATRDDVGRAPAARRVARGCAAESGEEERRGRRRSLGEDRKTPARKPRPAPKKPDS